MNPLIEITTVPIEIQMKVTDAKLEYVRGTAQMELSRDKGGLNIKSHPIRVNIDTFEARSSVCPTTAQSIEQSAEKGVQSAYKAPSVIAQEGRMMMEAKLDQDVIPQLAKQKSIGEARELNLEFLPSAAPELSWEGGEMSIRYEMDKLQLDWRINQSEFTFTPGDIEFVMTQRPEIIVKYVGGPLYVPPSSDPNYEPIDVKA